MEVDHWRLLKERLLKEFGAKLEACGSCIGDVVEEHFPILLGRIDWRKAPWSEERLGLQATEAAAFFDRCASTYHLDEPWVGFLGDSMPYAFRVRRENAGELLVATDEVADHKYIFSLSGDWCFDYMMEGYAHFGLAPAKRGRSGRSR